LADFVIRDNNSKLRVTCLKRDGNVFNLTGYTVQLKYRIGSTDHSVKSMTVVDADNGIAEYVLAQGIGIVIDATNNKLDLEFDSGPVTLTIPSGTYANEVLLTAAIEILFQAQSTYAHCFMNFGRVIMGSASNFSAFFATGPSFAVSAAPTLGFLPLDWLGSGSIMAEDTVIILSPDDLSEQGIMYCEIEIIETATGNIVSSSDELIFTVRGKVTNG